MQCKCIDKRSDARYSVCGFKGLVDSLSKNPAQRHFPHWLPKTLVLLILVFVALFRRLCCQIIEKVNGTQRGWDAIQCVCWYKTLAKILNKEVRYGNVFAVSLTIWVEVHLITIQLISILFYQCFGFIICLFLGKRVIVTGGLLKNNGVYLT